MLYTRMTTLAGLEGVCVCVWGGGGGERRGVICFFFSKKSFLVSMCIRTDMPDQTV